MSDREKMMGFFGYEKMEDELFSMVLGFLGYTADGTKS